MSFSRTAEYTSDEAKSKGKKSERDPVRKIEFFKYKVFQWQYATLSDMATVFGSQ